MKMVGVMIMPRKLIRVNKRGWLGVAFMWRSPLQPLMGARRDLEEDEGEDLDEDEDEDEEIGGYQSAFEQDFWGSPEQRRLYILLTDESYFPLRRQNSEDPLWALKGLQMELIQPIGRSRRLKCVTTPRLYGYRRKNSGNHIPANEEARMAAIRLAEELQSGLGSDSPSFVKSMYHSHVKTSFLLNFPASFCKNYLPKLDESITLLDEDGNECTTKYLNREHALSGGWIKFAKDHKLVDGDALVFQLIFPTKFKVYIVRANHDLAIVVHAKETDFNNSRGIDGAGRENCTEERPNIHSADMEDFTLSGSVCDFEKFRIIVNGKSVDHHFSKEVRSNYYNLCCSRKSYLHMNLGKSITCKRAIKVITKTVEIAKAIRECELSSSIDDFGTWEKTLIAFARKGMEVGFIRDRLNRLVRLVSESRVAAELKRYAEAKRKRDFTEEEIMSHQLSLVELKHKKEKIEDEMVAIRVNLHGHGCIFKEEASAPW